MSMTKGFAAEVMHIRYWGRGQDDPRGAGVRQRAGADRDRQSDVRSVLDCLECAAAVWLEGFEPWQAWKLSEVDIGGVV